MERDCVDISALAIPFGRPSWRVVNGWQFRVLFTGEPFGFSSSVAHAEIKVCEQSGIWEICLTASESDGEDAGSIISKYKSSGSLLQWQRNYPKGQPIITQSIIKAKEVDAFEVVSLDKNGIERSSFLPFDLEVIEPPPAWLLRTAFAVFNGNEHGFLTNATLNVADPTQKWASAARVNWSVSDDEVMTNNGNIKVWRLDGIEEGTDCSFAIFVDKVNQDILRLDMNSTKGALMLARAGN